MKEITDSVDLRIMFKHQDLMQDYLELQKETKFKMRKLEMMKQRQSILDAQVRFLRRRYKHLKQDQTLDLNVPSKPSGKRKKNSALRHKDALELDIKNPKRRRGDELPDLNGDGSTDNVPGFDLNQISREEEDPEGNGEQMVSEATKKAMLGCGIDGGMKLPICRDVEKELNRVAVKRKVSWQDPVALSV